MKGNITDMFWVSEDIHIFGIGFMVLQLHWTTDQVTSISPSGVSGDTGIGPLSCHLCSDVTITAARG